MSAGLFAIHFKYKKLVIRKFPVTSQSITSLTWPRCCLPYRPPHLKQHHWNNSWKFKILQLTVSAVCLWISRLTAYLLNWQQMDGPCVRVFTWRWVVGKVNYFDRLHWFTFSIRKKEPTKRIKIIHIIRTQISYRQPRENVLVLKNYKWELTL